MRGSYFWLRTTWLYTWCINKKLDSHITENLTSLSAFGSIFERILGTDVGKCEGRTFGWGWHDSIHNGYKRINKKIDYHILSKIRRAFRRSVPFLKIFEEPTSVDVRVVLLVGYDKTMYTCINEKIDSHITEIWRAFRRSVPFLKDF